MKIKEVVEKAVSFGYRRPDPCELDGIEFYHKGDTFLDPLFWQSLGKAMDWNQGKLGVCSGCGSRGEAENHIKCTCFDPLPEIIEEWKYQWQRFIDHLIEGKDAESFFENL